MKHHIGLRCYGRSADDAVVVHPDRAYLAALIPVAADWPHGIAEDHRPTRAERFVFRGGVSSYLGLMANRDTGRLRRRLVLEGLSPWWLKAARVDAGLRKVVLNK